MFGKFNYARSLETPYGTETFTAIECSSYDEAIKLVEKGIYDRKLQLEAEEKKKQNDTLLQREKEKSSTSVN